MSLLMMYWYCNNKTAVVCFSDRGQNIFRRRSCSYWEAWTLWVWLLCWQQRWHLEDTWTRWPLILTLTVHHCQVYDADTRTWLIHKQLPTTSDKNLFVNRADSGCIRWSCRGPQQWRYLLVSLSPRQTQDVIVTQPFVTPCCDSTVLWSRDPFITVKTKLNI